MDTFTLTFSVFVGLLCMVAIALTIWLVSCHRKLEKAWGPIEKEINRTRFTMARAIVLQHSDPEQDAPASPCPLDMGSRARSFFGGLGGRVDTALL